MLCPSTLPWLHYSGAFVLWSVEHRSHHWLFKTQRKVFRRASLTFNGIAKTVGSDIHFVFKMFWLLIWCCLFIIKMSNCMSSSCAPPPYVMCCCCHVICSHPPQAWDSIVLSLLCVRKLFQFFGGKQLWFREFFFFIWILFYFFVTISIQHCSRTPCLGNAAHPPTFPNKPHAFTISSCTHTRRHTQKSTPTHLPHSHPHPYRT